MPCYCSVYGCRQRWEKDSNVKITFHMIPKKAEDRQAWLEAIGRADPNNPNELWNPPNKTYVCCKHFEERCFDRTGQTVRLRQGTIPTLHLKPDLQPKVKTASEKKLPKKLSNKTKRPKKCPKMSIETDSKLEDLNKTDVHSAETTNRPTMGSGSGTTDRTIDTETTETGTAIGQVKDPVKIESGLTNASTTDDPTAGTRTVNTLLTTKKRKKLQKKALNAASKTDAKLLNKSIYGRKILLSPVALKRLLKKTSMSAKSSSSALTDILVSQEDLHVRHLRSRKILNKILYRPTLKNMPKKDLELITPADPFEIDTFESNSEIILHQNIAISPRVALRDHGYMLPSTAAIKRKLNESENHIQILEKKFRNSTFREKRLKANNKTLQEELDKEHILNKELNAKLEELSKKSNQLFKSTEEQKQFAMALHLYNSDAYRYMRETGFDLPHPRSVQRWLKNIKNAAENETESELLVIFEG